MDVHYEYGLVCWADIKQEQIKCSSFDNSVTSKYVNRLGISKNEVEEEVGARFKATSVNCWLHLPILSSVIIYR